MTQSHSIIDPDKRESVPPAFITIYIFEGTKKRFGIGHIALSDGYYTYSYPRKPHKSNVKVQPSLDEKNEGKTKDEPIYLDFIDYEALTYGPYQKIILPINQTLEHNIKSIRKEFSKEAAWENDNYSVAFNNCAHMVQRYLTLANYTDPIQDDIIPLCPSEVAAKAKKVGMAMANDLSLEGIANGLIKDHLELLRSKLDDEISPLRDILEAKQSKKDLKDTFKKAFHFIAMKHYEGDHKYDELYLKALEDVFFWQPNKINKVYSDTTWIDSLYQVAKRIGRIILSPLVLIALPIILLLSPKSTSETQLRMLEEEQRIEPPKNYFRKKLYDSKKFFYKLSFPKKVAVCFLVGLVVIAVGVFSGGTVYAGLAGVGITGALATAVTTVGVGHLVAGIGALVTAGAAVGTFLYNYIMLGRPAFAPRSIERVSTTDLSAFKAFSTQDIDQLLITAKRSISKQVVKKQKLAPGQSGEKENQGTPPVMSAPQDQATENLSLSQGINLNNSQLKQTTLSP